MAIKVGEGLVDPLAQAEPSEAAIPARSSCIRQGVTLDAREAEIDCLGKSQRVIRWTVANNMARSEGRNQARFESIPQTSPASRPRRGLVVPLLQSSGQPDGERDRHRTRAPTLLLATAE